jgi:soluble lytic murein transglycosylase-like protein
MGELMPRVAPYTEQISATGHNNDFQDPSTADGGVGQAARSIGQSISRISMQHKAVENDQGRMWAAAATAENEVRQRKAQSDYVNSLDPSAPDYLDKINALPDKTDEQYTQSIDQLQESAPNEMARKYVAMHGANGRVRMLDASITDSANLNASYAVSQVDTATKTSTDLIAAAPDNATFDEVNARHRQTIMDMTTLDPRVKLKLADDSTHTFAVAQVQSLAAKDPSTFLQTVNAQGGTTTRGVTRGQVPGGSALIDAVTQVESNGNPNAVSPKGARGSMQVMPYTADNPGFGIAPAKDQSDAELRRVGSQYLDAMGKKYGDQRLALAAYNAGPAAVDAAVKSAGGDVDKALASLPAETQAYVPKVQALMGSPAGDPQVQPLTDTDIANAKPGVAGWDHLSWPEKVSAVRNAEAQVGKALAEDRGALSREVTDANAALLDGKPVPGLSSARLSADNLKRVFGDDQGGRMAQELAYSANVGDFVTKAKIMPAAQRQTMLAQFEPQPGEGYAEKSRVYTMAQQAVAQVEKQQQAAPIASAIASGIANAKPLDFSQPETLASQLHDRTVVAATMVRDYGTKPQIFTADEVKTLADALGNQTGKDRIATLANIRIGLNDPGAFGTAMNELAPKNPTLAYAANLAARDGVAYVDGKATLPADVATNIADGDIILNGRSLDRQMAKGDDPSMPGGKSAANFNDTQFRQQFNQALGSAFRSPDAQLSASAQQEAYNAARAYYAADAYKQGKPLDQIDPATAQRAIVAVVGQPIRKNGGTLLAPFGMKTEDFQKQWNDRAKATIEGAGFDGVSTDRLLDTAVPVNLADGLYGFQVGTRMLADPRTGRKVVVSFRDKH